METGIGICVARTLRVPPPCQRCALPPCAESLPVSCAAHALDDSAGVWSAASLCVQIDYPVSVIAVVGLYRTGKSFLMNRILLEQSDGFTVGPTVNPCTKGLWLWNKVMSGVDKDGKDVKYLIVDTEGIGALDTNSQHDSIIFSLALLLSSNFIYNSVGSIDEGALNNLSLVVNLTKHIHVRSSNSGSAEDDGADFAQYFPTFLWLVRDFTLQLVNSDGQAFSSKEYLERALQPVPGFTEQIEAKNRIRRMLTHFFPDRDCFTMVRPVTDESLLQKLSSTPSEQLRPEFVQQMGKLRSTIMNSAKTKRMHGTELDGLALVNLAFAYTQSINTGSVPSIQNAWNYICETKCQHALTAALKHYENAAKDLVVELPMGIDELDVTHRKLEQEAWKLFQKDAMGDGQVCLYTHTYYVDVVGRYLSVHTMGDGQVCLCLHKYYVDISVIILFTVSSPLNTDGMFLYTKYVVHNTEGMFLYTKYAITKCLVNCTCHMSDVLGDGQEEYNKQLETKILEMYKGLQKENSARGREKAKVLSLSRSLSLSLSRSLSLSLSLSRARSRPRQHTRAHAISRAPTHLFFLFFFAHFFFTHVFFHFRSRTRACRRGWRRNGVAARWLRGSAGCHCRRRRR